MNIKFEKFGKHIISKIWAQKTSAKYEVGIKYVVYERIWNKCARTPIFYTTDTDLEKKFNYFRKNQ